MPGYKDERRFSGSLDLDSDYRLVAPNDYIYAEGVLDGPGNLGSKTNYKGQTKITIPLDPVQNKVIGTLADIKRQAIIYFIWNGQGSHCILHYFVKTRTIEPILKRDDTIPFTTEFLGFTEHNKIHSANILDDILTWTDNNVSPRKLNIKRAKDFMNQLAPSFENTPYDNLIATGSLDQKLQFIESIKYPPVVKPLVQLGLDVDRKTNYLREKMAQFRYRWIYDDGEKSVWSTGSYVTLPNGEENVLGYFNNPAANNYVDVTLQTGHPTVSQIEIGVRFGNSETWFKIDTPIKKYDIDNQRLILDYASYIYRFYNDRVLIVFSDEESLTNYHAIPHLAKTQEIIDGNRLIYGNYVEGFDNPDIDVTGSYTFTGVPIQVEKPFDDVRTASTNKFSICPINDDLVDYTAGMKFANNPLAPLVNWYDQVLLIPTDKSLVRVGTVIKFHLDYRTHLTGPNPYGGTFSGITKQFDVVYTVLPDDLLNWPLNLQNSLLDAVGNLGGYTNQIIFWDEDYDTIPYHSIIFENYLNPGDNPFAARITSFDVINPADKVPTYKKGAFHKFAIEYFDYALRDGGALTSESMSVYVPYLSEVSAAPAPYSQTIGDKAIISFTINHRPPEFATHYRFLYALSNLSKYAQFVIKGEPVTNAQGNVEIDCTYIVDYITVQIPDSSLDFQPESGDRLRFVANSEDVAYDYVETKVLKYDAGTKKLTVTAFDQSMVISQMTSPSFEGTLCELFRVNAQTENQIYYEIGEERAILEAGTPDRRHAGDTQNQSPDLSVPAIVELRRGDSYLNKRYFNNNAIGVIVESEDFSDFYDSKNIDISRVQAVTNSVRKRYEVSMRYGGRYFPGTNTNDLLAFIPGDDRDTLETTFGPLNRFITVGFVLKAIQTRKLTSIYINRNMIFTANGDQQITLIDRVLGTKYPSDTDYGTEHPESVVRDDRVIFFFDVNSSAMVQDDANGPASVSKYAAKTFFINKTNEINTVTNKSLVFCFTAIDKVNDLLVVTFKDESGLFEMPEATITYNYVANRWKSFLPVNAECYGSNGTCFVSFVFGELYVNNDSPFRNLYFGAVYPQKIKFVSNVDPTKVKTFDAIAINSNKPWYSPEFSDITIPACDQFPQGMSSRLIESKFRTKEGVYYASYMKDANTPNFPGQDIALIEGRSLKGEVLVQQIQNLTTDEVILFGVIVHSTPSEKSR